MKYAMEHLPTNGTSNANITSTEEHFGELLIKPTLKLHKNHYSGPSAALHVEHLNYTNRATAMHRNGKPCNSLFSWSTQLAVWIAGACVLRRRRQTTTLCNMAVIQVIQSWFTAHLAQNAIVSRDMCLQCQVYQHNFHVQKKSVVIGQQI